MVVQFVSCNSRKYGYRICTILVLITLISCGCNVPGISTPTPEILIDSFFFGHALIDINGNGQVDNGDAPLEGARFTATDARGASGGGYTDKDGSAFAWWPGESQYPVTLHMEAPEGSSLVIIGASDITLEKYESSATFLYKKIDQDIKPTLSDKRCGDSVCDGPENISNCPQDCATTLDDSVSTAVPSRQPSNNNGSIVASLGDQPNTYWVENPTSGVQLYVMLLYPSKWNGESMPALLVIPGGINSGSEFIKPPTKMQRLSDEGFIVIVFDADGRGLSKGEEDYNGFIHQDGLAAVALAAASFPGVDASRLGVVSYSYGVTMATGALARHPDLPVRYYIDWEGPVSRIYTTTGCNPESVNRISFEDCSNDAWWIEREALTFIGSLRIPYQRIQSQIDHVQAENSHAIRMINAAVEGGVPWVRLNDEEPNQTYDEQYPPAMLPEDEDRLLEHIIAIYAKYILTLMP